MTSAHVVVGRQPIFDRELLMVGYELLFRPPGLLSGTGNTTPGDEMTASVFSSALSIGLDRLVGDKNIFCNADSGVLTGAVPLLLPPDRTTVELTDCHEYTLEVEEGCRTLAGSGYQLAIDDFSWFPDIEKLLAWASVVKIDIRHHGLKQAFALADRAKEFGVLTVAHKVETELELARCMDHGFDLLQGFALARPSTISGATLEASKLGALQLAAAALDSTVDIDEVERIVRRDPALTVQLLQIASIGPLGETKRSVHSIREALVLLGTERLRSWVTLLMLRSTRTTATDELVGVLVRARTCELLANRNHAGFAFTAGMVSALDRFLGIPAAELAEMLPLDKDLIAAAFTGDGAVGRLVHQVMRNETDSEHVPHIQVAGASALDWAMQSAELLELA